MILRYFNVAGADPLGRTGHSATGATHSSRSRSKPRSDCLDLFAPTTQRRTAPASGITFTSPISLPRISDALAYPRASGASMTLNCGYGRGF